MAIHITIYPDEHTAAALRGFMADHDCTATTAVELLLMRWRNPTLAPTESAEAAWRRVSLAVDS